MLDLVPVYRSYHPHVDAATQVAVPSFPHLEMPSFMLWPPGFALGKNKFTKSVLHWGFAIALSGHDVGPLLKHWPCGPPNAILFVAILKSKRKVKFTSGQVKADKKAVACTYCLPFPWPRVPTPMSYCSKPFDIPASGSPTVHLASLIVGQHWVELVADWAGVILECILQYLMRSDSVSQPTRMEVVSDLLFGFESLGDFSGDVDWRNDLKKSLPGIGRGVVSGLIRMAGQRWFGYRGDAEIPITVSSGPVEVEVSLSSTVDEHGNQDFSGEGQFQIGGDGLNLHGGVEIQDSQQAEGTVGVGFLWEERDHTMTSAGASQPLLQNLPEL